MSAVIDTRTPITYLHFTLASGASFTQPLAREMSAFVYVIDGSGRVGDTAARDAQMVILENDGDAVTLTNDGTVPFDLLLIAGVPLREPVAHYGPFVMNTERELMQAVDDYQNGRFGVIPPTV